ncbi:hypothetical protein HOT75_gp143 [Gordonia phage Daredevil]|uniref:Uncharacterized protein n=1 Tax=Gordonia phage Daredevil TaxID=2283286 RepID=A0A345MIZ8_9CAUD|nr:hypothetical protein HOT75_gp143 [Gordonia phage Daredevil]AXH70529.1 hypothetical protein SEA_DAREDEVIL_143 [Gordonia phage Daredevil]
MTDEELFEAARSWADLDTNDEDATAMAELIDMLADRLSDAISEIDWQRRRFTSISRAITVQLNSF